jgi:hypothetical protein
MRQRTPTIPPQLNSSQALFRFVVRLLLLSTFAIFSSQGSQTAFAILLGMSAIYCAMVGAMRREAVFGSTLTHWDEAAAYAVMGHAVSAFV